MKVDILRITTVSLSLEKLLNGQLAYIEKNGFSIATIANGKFDHSQHYNLPSLTRSISPFKDLVAIWKVIRLIRKLQPSIVHTHTPKAGLVGMIAARICGVPHRLHTVAGLPLMEKHGAFRRLLLLIEKFTYKAATLVLPNSKGLYTFIENEIYAGSKLHIIGHGSSNGIDLKHFNQAQINLEQQSKLKKKLGIYESNLVFFFIGRMVKDKGIEELVNAFVEVNKAHRGSKLLLVGPLEPELDPIDPSVLGLISDHADIVSVGFVDDVRPYIAIGDILTFPSYREGFPNVPMQAACFKKALILSNINGCNELVENGVNGLLVPAKNSADLVKAMLEYANNKELRNSHASAALRNIESNYSQDYVWSEILKLYKGLIS